MAIDTSRTFKPINIALLTVSDTRGPDEDTSGDILAERIRLAGHKLAGRALEPFQSDAAGGEQVGVLLREVLSDHRHDGDGREEAGRQRDVGAGAAQHAVHLAGRRGDAIVGHGSNNNQGHCFHCSGRACRLPGRKAGPRRMKEGLMEFLRRWAPIAIKNRPENSVDAGFWPRELVDISNQIVPSIRDEGVAIPTGFQWVEEACNEFLQANPQWSILSAADYAANPQWLTAAG